MNSAGMNMERHTLARTGWLRAVVLGANDGIVSISSLVIGVAASNVSPGIVLTAGLAGLVGGSISMAAGEYVSVSSQRDTERANLRREAYELEHFPEAELQELAGIYEERGLSPETARHVAEELSAGDRLTVHARDELGLHPHLRARPWQAAWTSALAFGLGAALPIVATAITPKGARIAVTAIAALVALGLLGMLGARLGGGSARRAALRVLVGGVLAMALTAAIGRLVGVST